MAGIQDPDNEKIRTDVHDKRAIDQYSVVTDELISRLDGKGAKLHG